MSVQTLAGRLLTDQELQRVSGGDGICFSVPTLSGCPSNPDGSISACDDEQVGGGCEGPPMVYPGIPSGP
jgi:hypothetical protein